MNSCCRTASKEDAPDEVEQVLRGAAEPFDGKDGALQDLSRGPTQEDTLTELNNGEMKTIAREGSRPNGEKPGGVDHIDYVMMPAEKTTFQTLEAASGKALTHQVNQRKRARHQEEGGHHGHGHGPKKPSVINAIISGFINYLLMFGLCCAYGMIMFNDDFNKQHRAMGVKMNLSTAFFTGILLSARSKVGVAIGGPDLNPVVFIGAFVDKMSKKIAEDLSLDDQFEKATERRLVADESVFDTYRRLAKKSSKDVEFCTGAHKTANKNDCEEYHEKLRATTIFATAVSSAILGLIYFTLGYLKVTRVVSFVPTSVQEAFLSCIGYKVFKYALSFCNNKPLMFIPAACIGVTLYFFKAQHLGNPAVVIPTMVLVPLGIFYIIVFAAGLDIEDMRESGASDNWMFAELEHINFWTIFTDSYGKAGQISFKAWLETLPDLAIMIVVCTIDCLLKISSTESKLPVKVDKDYEACLYGAGNIITTITGSSVGYMQLKFNVINYGVVGNTWDRRGGFVYAFLCGACYFAGIWHFNFLPRFFLGILLFFAGAGFVAENLWGSRKYLSLIEWAEILIILAVFIFSGSLLAAVGTGILVTCVSLIVKYTKVSCIAGHPLPGGHITSAERRNPLLLGQMKHIADSWYVVIRLKGFIFFASAQKMTARVLQFALVREELPLFRQLRYIVLDCEMLDGMDASAGKSVRKLLSDLKALEVKLLWTNVDKDMKANLIQKEMMANEKHAFDSLEQAVLFIEDEMIEYQKVIQKRWIDADMLLKLHYELARVEDDCSPWPAVLLKPAARVGIPWRYCTTVDLHKCQTILWTPGQMDRGLFLVHTGKVAMYTELPDPTAENVNWPVPVAIYGHGWFLNREFILGKPTTYYAVAIEGGQALQWSQDQWWKMFSDRPRMANELMTAVYAQNTMDLGAAAWIAEMDGEEKDDISTPLQDQVGTTQKLAQMAIDWTEAHRHTLPEQLKVLIDTLEVAEAFGNFGVYDADSTELAQLPPLPQQISDDLAIAFSTYAVSGSDGTKRVLAKDVNQALNYAGISKAIVDTQVQESFSKSDFRTLGHHAYMARLPVSIVMKLQNIVVEQRKKNGWAPGLGAHQVGFIFRTYFHRSFTTDFVHGLMQLMDLPKTDEEIMLSLCAILFKWHEVYYHLLVDVKMAGKRNRNTALGVELPTNPLPEDTANAATGDASNTFTVEALEKLLKPVDEAAKFGKEEDDHGHDDHAAEHPQEAAQAEPPIPAEVLWACDWPRRMHTGDHWGQRLHVYDVALSVLTRISHPMGKLHPFPVIEATSDKDRGAGESQLDASKFLVQVEDMKNHTSIAQVKKLRKSTHSEIATGESVKDHNSHTLLGSIKEQVEHVIFDAPSADADASQATTPSMLPFVPDQSLGLRQQIHITLEDPGSSLIANWVSLAMGVMIIISILTMFIKPVVEHGREDDVPESEKKVWWTFELILTVIFTTEYVVRFLVADANPDPKHRITQAKFVLAPANVCDILAIIPFYIEAAFDSDAQEMRLLRIVRLLRLTRIARIGRLANRSVVFPPIAMCLIVIWGIYMKTGLSGSK